MDTTYTLMECQLYTQQLHYARCPKLYFSLFINQPSLILHNGFFISYICSIFTIPLSYCISHYFLQIIYTPIDPPVNAALCWDPADSLRIVSFSYSTLCGNLVGVLTMSTVSRPSWPSVLLPHAYMLLVSRTITEYHQGIVNISLDTSGNCIFWTSAIV